MLCVQFKGKNLYVLKVYDLKFNFLYVYIFLELPETTETEWKVFVGYLKYTGCDLSRKLASVPASVVPHDFKKKKATAIDKLVCPPNGD